MKPPSSKNSWAGLLASGFVIVSGFISTLFVILAFSDSQKRDLALVIGVFTIIIFIPIWALRTPAGVEEKPRGWWKFWRRRRKKKDSMQRYWRRRRGQERNKPYGHKEVIRPSTFVAAPRKPTDP